MVGSSLDASLLVLVDVSLSLVASADDIDGSVEEEEVTEGEGCCSSASVLEGFGTWRRGIDFGFGAAASASLPSPSTDFGFGGTKIFGFGPPPRAAPVANQAKGKSLRTTIQSCAVHVIQTRLSHEVHKRLQKRDYLY